MVNEFIAPHCIQHIGFHEVHSSFSDEDIARMSDHNLEIELLNSLPKVLLDNLQHLNSSAIILGTSNQTMLQLLRLWPKLICCVLNLLQTGISKLEVRLIVSIENECLTQEHSGRLCAKFIREA